jgi:hypothetical protein
LSFGVCFLGWNEKIVRKDGQRARWRSTGYMDVTNVAVYSMRHEAILARAWN